MHLFLFFVVDAMPGHRIFSPPPLLLLLSCYIGCLRRRRRRHLLLITDLWRTEQWVVVALAAWEHLLGLFQKNIISFTSRPFSPNALLGPLLLSSKKSDFSDCTSVTEAGSTAGPAAVQRRTESRRFEEMSADRRALGGCLLGWFGWLVGWLVNYRR